MSNVNDQPVQVRVTSMPEIGKPIYGVLDGTTGIVSKPVTSIIDTGDNRWFVITKDQAYRVVL